MYVIATVYCSNFHFSVSLHVPFLNLLFEQIANSNDIRWNALDEIYKLYMLLHRSDLNILANFRQTFPHFSAFFWGKSSKKIT